VVAVLGEVGYVAWVSGQVSSGEAGREAGRTSSDAELQGALCEQCGREAAMVVEEGVRNI